MICGKPNRGEKFLCGCASGTYQLSKDLLFICTVSPVDHLATPQIRPFSNVVLLPYSAGSTVARLQHDLVSDVEFNSVGLKAVGVNMRQTITNRFCWLLKESFNN